MRNGSGGPQQQRTRNELRALLNAPEEVKPVTTLMNDVLAPVHRQMASDIEQELSSTTDAMKCDHLAFRGACWLARVGNERVETPVAC